MRSFSTGEAAKITKTSVQTVIRWIEQGMLKAWKVPGSRFRRIEEHNLRAFMVKHNIPLHFLDARIEKILIISEHDPHRALLGERTKGLPFICAGMFEAGMRLVDSPIAAVIVDESLGEVQTQQIVNTMAARASEIPVISMTINPDNQPRVTLRASALANRITEQISEALNRLE